jgi:endonuclease/exonuclease/phosphatase family metal-dependent hydrolase
MKLSVLLFVLLSTQVWAKWSVSTYNIRNFDNDSAAGPTDLVALEKIIKSVQSDVMAFEEVVNEKAFIGLIKKVLPGYQIELSECGGFGKQKLALVYNPRTFNFISKSEDLSFSGGGNQCGSLRPVFLVSLEEKKTAKTFTFGVVHLKAGGNSRAFGQRWKQYEGLVKLAENFAQKNLILLGDFNTTGYNIKDEDYTRFESFIGAAALRSTSENIACTNYWHGPVTGARDYQSSVLDHIVIQDKQYAEVLAVQVAAHCAKEQCRPASPEQLGTSFQSVSDHCPVQVSFK